MQSVGLLTVQEAAEYLGMSKAWLYDSEVPFVKLGSSRRYRLEDLAAFVAKRVQR